MKTSFSHAVAGRRKARAMEITDMVPKGNKGALEVHQSLCKVNRDPEGLLVDAVDRVQ